MKLYWDTIRRPSRDRWYRWFIVVLLVSTNIPNIIVATAGSMGGDVRWLNVIVMLFSFAVLAGHMYFWARQDLDNREALKRLVVEPLPSNTISAGVRTMNGKWLCTKCLREEAFGYDDGQLPEHHRTCPKAVTP